MRTDAALNRLDGSTADVEDWKTRSCRVGAWAAGEQATGASPATPPGREGLPMADSTHVGLAGELYVLAQLAQRGLVASLTLANTKAVDILVFDEGVSRYSRLEIKTAGDALKSRERYFSEEPFYAWTMSEKHECVEDPRLFYGFVALQGLQALPLFFLVPSRYVAAYVREQHRYWVRARGCEFDPTTKMRKFRIPVADPNGFRDNWPLLSGKQPPANQLGLSEPWFSPAT
jgi:hypothetical protein